LLLSISCIDELLDYFQQVVSKRIFVFDLLRFITINLCGLSMFWFWVLLLLFMNPILIFQSLRLIFPN